MHKYKEWISNKNLSKELLEELIKIKDDEKAIEDRFFKELTFGTGGLRGKLGAGTNRMNVYTVSKATFGLADYIINCMNNHSVIIAYDSRHMSKEFAFTSADILSSKGIKVYIFDTLMPTPVLSYAVRYFKAGCGIVITASHNPKEYNGYKVYNSVGSQITDEVANTVTSYISKYGYFNTYTPNDSLIEKIGESILDKFIDTVLTYSLGFDKKNLPNSIVYTPLCGTGNVPIQKLFYRMGITNYSIVEEQREPNGDFITCPFPNPEEKSALNLALKLAKRKNADIVIATDPDADRVGVAVKDGDDYRLLNGNETGILIEFFILETLKRQNRLPSNGLIVKTIVTSPLAEKIARSYGVNVENVLTGFKYIGETIDRKLDKQFIFGLEESFGYLIGTHVRDKDAISTVMAIIEAYSYYKSKNQSFIDALNDIYSKFGVYATKLIYKVYEGADGAVYMDNFLKMLRENPYSEIAGITVNKIVDYNQGINGLPKSNVLSYQGDNFTFIIRASGTEPKIKIYIMAGGETEKDSIVLANLLESFAKHIL